MDITGYLVPHIFFNFDISIFVLVLMRKHFFLSEDRLTLFEPTNAAFENLSTRVLDDLTGNLHLLKGTHF